MILDLQKDPESSKFFVLAHIPPAECWFGAWRLGAWSLEAWGLDSWVLGYLEQKYSISWVLVILGMFNPCPGHPSQPEENIDLSIKHSKFEAWRLEAFVRPQQ